MEMPSQSERVAKSIRSLTVAVWCLVAVSVVQLAGWLFPFIAPGFLASRVFPSSTFESWEGLSFEEKAKRASVILITENKQEEGVLHGYIREELKRKPGTVFQYAVGDVYPPLTLTPKEKTSYGDGSLVLLRGSPAREQESMSIFSGNVTALDNMPLSKIRQVIAEAK
jgi:hypothetical protein